jgi:hypothetical protein
MGTWNAFYVRKSAAEARDAILAAFPDAEVEDSTSFLGVAMPQDAFKPPEAALSALSERLGTDVLWLSFQSLVDAFQFHHWCKGKRVRSLVFGCFVEERTWESVEGSAEPWEREVFFDVEELAFALKHARDDGERAELRRIWREAEIRPGRTQPSIYATECAHKIAAYYELPHYGR